MAVLQGQVVCGGSLAGEGRKGNGEVDDNDSARGVLVVDDR
jgi:hypothetical protein